MPVFVPLFIGAAVVSAMSGTGMFVKGVSDHGKAKKLNDDSKTRSELAASRLEELRKQCNNAMEELGREKLVILEGNIGREYLTDDRANLYTARGEDVGGIPFVQMHECRYYLPVTGIAFL